MKSPRLRTLVAAFFAIGAALTLSNAALAAPTAKETRWADAITALKKADKLDPNPALAVDLAQAQVGAGKLIEASKTLSIVAEGTDNAHGAKKAREAAKKALADLKPRIPSVTVKVKGAPADKVSLVIDGIDVDASGEVAVNPGDHTVGAGADGFVSVEKEVHFAEGAHERVTLTLVAKQAAPVADKASGSRVPGAVVTAIGGAALAAGGVFGGLAFSATSTAKAQCSGLICPPTAQNDIARAKLFGNVSTGMFIGGGAVAVTGIVLLAVAPGGGKSDDAAKSARVMPWFGPGGAGLGATGSF
jgi:hypothetical protein